MIGEYDHQGQEWQPKKDPQLGKVIPYEIYDLGSNLGWVNVGVDHDTAALAMASIKQWWQEMGSLMYGEASALLITADCGGSNGYRVRLWKSELQCLSLGNFVKKPIKC